MKLFFRKSGYGSPLVILHGLFGMSDNWVTLSKYYATQGFEVFLPDLRNHGQSEHSLEFDYKTMASDLAEFASVENLDQASWVGHSMGGKAAMFLACLYPHLLKELVVVDISPAYYKPHHQQVLEGIRAVDLQNINSRSEAENQMAVKIEDLGVRQFLLKNLYWKENIHGEKKLAWRFNLDVIEQKIEQVGIALPHSYSFSGPTLFIRGEKSDYIQNHDSELIVKHFPNARIETVTNAGHWVHADNPQGFSDVLLKFIKKTV